jgi:hypothetical protein
MSTHPPPGRGASANLLAGDRLFLQQGPINLIIKAYGPQARVREAYSKACAAFSGLLEGLVAELGVLRQPLLWSLPVVQSATAQRMVAAVAPYRRYWITPMAAVAGAVAETVAAALRETPELEKFFVNNGGDIAVWVAPGQTLTIGVVPSLKKALPEAQLELRAEDGVGGVATSGWDGHSFSFGIADAVTVLADDAANADAAATLIGNAVNIEYPGIQRRPAAELDPESDLGRRRVTTAVPPLPTSVAARALERGAAFAAELVEQGRIKAALLALQGQWRKVGALG